MSPTSADNTVPEPSTEPVENFVNNLRAMPPKPRATGLTLSPPKLYAAVNRLAETMI